MSRYRETQLQAGENLNYLTQRFKGLTLSAQAPSYTSEYDVRKRQILTCKDVPRTERIKIIIIVVDTSHMYSNESLRAN